MSEPFVRGSEAIEYEHVEAAEGLRKGVLVDKQDGAPTLALRRFVLEPGGRVPRHTNELEHEQYVLSGNYTVGIDDTEHRVEPGDTLHIPAGIVHWYHNEGNREAAFLCAVPTGDDTIQVK